MNKSELQFCGETGQEKRSFHQRCDRTGDPESKQKHSQEHLQAGIEVPAEARENQGQERFEERVAINAEMQRTIEKLQSVDEHRYAVNAEHPQTIDAYHKRNRDVERLRVLIVEDNADSRTLLSTLLEMEGHEVIVAKDGEVGLAAILREQPDVALVDIGLPLMTGYEVVRKVRELAPTIRTRLVAVTGYGQAQDVQNAVKAGFDEHLTKPIDLEVVIRLLSSRAKGR